MKNIADILSILTIIYNRGGATTREISEITNISPKVVYKNLYFIYENEHLFRGINIFNIDVEDNDDIEDAFWSITLELSEKVKIALDIKEKKVFDSILTQKNKEDLMEVMVKGIYETSYDKYLKYSLTKISIAVNNEKKLNIEYELKNNIKVRYDIEPLGIIYYEFENIFYIAGQYDGKLVFYNLSKIHDIKETKISFTKDDNCNLEEYLENIWGMEMGNPVKVRIKFIKEANVEYKVKRETAYRRNKVIIDNDKYFIYEDIIIGINSFKSWLRSYGRSAIVLEPPELREDMIMSAKRALEFYMKQGEKINE